MLIDERWWRTGYVVSMDPVFSSSKSLVNSNRWRMAPLLAVSGILFACMLCSCWERAVRYGSGNACGSGLTVVVGACSSSTCLSNVDFQLALG